MFLHTLYLNATQASEWQSWIQKITTAAEMYVYLSMLPVSDYQETNNFLIYECIVPYTVARS